MRNFFKPSEIFEDSCFVADYSKKTDSRVGVILSREPFEDIKYFHLQKGRNATPFRGVNLEKHTSFIKGISNCECFFFPDKESEHNWILFLEMKYCEAENLENYGLEVVKQMGTVFQKLIDLNLIDKNRYNVYFNFASPDNEAPFTNFMLSCDTALKFKERFNAKFLGYNHLLIATPQYIQVPKKTI